MAPNELAKFDQISKLVHYELGANATILPGLIMSEVAVAGSVVTIEVKPFSTIYGIPT